MTETSFGELLRQLRAAAGLSQEELAARAVLSAQAISALERGVRSAPYRQTIDALATALDLGAADRALLIAAARRRVRVAAAPTIAAASPPGNLPASPTPLIGRAAAIAAAAARLRDPAVRLLTVTGPGGVGKSRLALAVAESLAADFPDGVYFVPLAALDDPAQVAAAVARTLGIAERSTRPPREAVPAALREKRLLLLLDNFEHLPAAAGFVEELLAACPHLRVLATSRAPLGTRREQEWPALPLTLPARGQVDPASLAETAAVALFVARATAVRPEFVLTRGNAPAVAAICRRLGGLPLALELAAARLRLLSPAALLERLDAPLRLLAGSAPDLPERQRTMRATIAWSHDLLPPEQAAAFRRLAVFAGGWTLAAAEEVCAAAGDDPGAALDAVGALAGHSLLHHEPPPPGVGPEDELEPRLGMLEMVREFALERLRASGEEGATRRRHAAHFLALAEEAAPVLAASAQADWLARLEREYGNLRAALGWAIDAGDADMALRLAGSLTQFWRMRGHFREGRGWLERALATDDAPSVLRARALLGAGALAWRQGDLAAAGAHLAAALALARERGDTATAAGALHFLGIVAAHDGDLERAQALNEESLALRRALGDRPGMAAALNSLGEVARRRGDWPRAAALYGECLELNRAVDFTFGHAVALHNLGEVALASGDLAAAAGYFRASLSLHQGLGNTYSVAYQIAGLAGVAALAGATTAAARAARLFGAAEGIFAVSGAHMDPADRPGHERRIAAARDQLGADAFAAAWEAGKSLALDDAIAEALAGEGAGG